MSVDFGEVRSASTVEPGHRSDGIRHRAATIETAARILLEAPRVAVMSHVRTDGDGLTAWALAAVLHKLSKAVQVFVDVPSELTWLAPAEGVLSPARALHPEAGVVTVDCANYVRNAWPEPERQRIAALVTAYGGESQVPLDRFDAVRPVTLAIDHHITNRGYGLWNWLDPERSSVAEMVLELIQVLQEQTGRDDLADEQVAQWLMVGLVTSTDWFRHDTDSRTWRAVEWLERIGRVDKERLAHQLDAVSVDYFHLSGALRRLTHVQDGVASAMVPRRLLDHYGVSDSEAARFIDELTTLRADVYLLFLELADGTIRVRLRGRGLEVHHLAARFGGGGHERASGAVVKDWAEARRLLRAARRTALSARAEGAGTRAWQSSQAVR